MSTGSGRFAQRQIERHRRLAPVGDLIVGPNPCRYETRRALSGPSQRVSSYAVALHDVVGCPAIGRMHRVGLGSCAGQGVAIPHSRALGRGSTQILGCHADPRGHHISDALVSLSSVASALPADLGLLHRCLDVLRFPDDCGDERACLMGPPNEWVEATATSLCGRRWVRVRAPDSLRVPSCRGCASQRSAT